MENLLCRLLDVNSVFATADLLTRPISVMDLDLYAANAFALAKWISNGCQPNLIVDHVSYKEQVILYQIMLEVVDRQRPIGHTLHKIMTWSGVVISHCVRAMV